MKPFAALVLITAALVASAARAAPPKPGDFVAHVRNPWFPLKPGTTFVYRGEEDGVPLRDVVAVTRRTRVVDGVRCTVVHDVVYKRGKVVERTDDWYAQDQQGAVWYFGEATAELENGRVKTTEGSWESGVAGAVPGVLIPAHPHVGQSGRQEYWKGHAEDEFRIVSLSATVKVPYTQSTHALLAKEWSRLEPGVVDHKLYVRGVGLVEEVTVAGGNERAVLVSVQHA